MDSNVKDAIVVGVTGPGQETAALRFAAECARRDGAEVVVVHAFRASSTGPPPSALLTYADAAHAADRVVTQAGAELAEIAGPTVALRTLALAGSPSKVLTEAGHGARMVVVQHRESHILRRLFVGSAVSGVAAHAECPVVSVPEGWEPGTGSGEVVVGVHEGGVPLPVVAAGFAWASATGAPLRVVHGWRLDAAYDDIITERVAADWREQQKRSLSAAVQGFRLTHPDVSVTVEVRHQWPSDVLVDDSRVASLVIIGRHGPHPWEPEHLGSLARTVLREAKSPVMVVPVRRHEDAPDDWDVAAHERSPQT